MNGKNGMVITLITGKCVKNCLTGYETRQLQGVKRLLSIC